ncbi:hypothetical protein ACLB2K_042105 [Fragaria x ananassa]
MATYRALLSLKSSLDDPDSRLSALRLLNLSNNVFNRTFPPELSNLTNLRVLDLYNNNLTGVLPVSVATFHCHGFENELWHDLQVHAWLRRGLDLAQHHHHAALNLLPPCMPFSSFPPQFPVQAGVAVTFSSCTDFPSLHESSR